MALAPQARVGEVFDSKYRIEELLGSGAMGSVFRARHVALGRPVAVKLLHPRLLKDAKMRRRFEREAKLAGKLHHPNVISVVDAGTHDGVSFLVMDLADGVALSTLLAEAPFPPSRAVPLIRQILDGLAHAHDHGLIHRDLKPDNIIVDGDGTARIIDFGIALLREGSDAPERVTTGGVVLGTPHYMAPEHAMNRDIDHRIDLFALGVICFQMLTGRMPFKGGGVTVATANISTPTPQMGVDPLLEAFTHKLMAKERDRRPATAGAARDLLDLVVQDPTAAAKQLGADELASRPTESAGMTPPAAGSAAIAFPRHKPERSGLGAEALGTAPTLAMTTKPLLTAKRRRLAIIAVLAAIAVAVIALVTLR